MKLIIIIYFLIFHLYMISITLSNDNNEKTFINIGIIGCGIGGASLTTYLRQLWPDNSHLLTNKHALNIDIYDKNDYIGGRTKSINLNIKNINNNKLNKIKNYEIGGSIIYNKNENIINLISLLNLNKTKPIHKNNKFGLYDGNNIIYNEISNNKLINKFHIFQKYGISILSLNNIISNIIKNFNNIYNIQNEHEIYFNNNVDLLKEINLYNLTQTRFDRYILNEMKNHLYLSYLPHFITTKISDPWLLLDELISAIIRVNYNQNTEINSLAGCVALCPFTTGDIFSIEGGNDLLSKKLIKKYSNNIYLNTEITDILIHEYDKNKKKYSLFSNNGKKLLGIYDTIVLATPIYQSKIIYHKTNILPSYINNNNNNNEIILSNYNDKKILNLNLFTNEYQRTVATLIFGKLNPKYFYNNNINNDNNLPDSIYISSPKNNIPISAITKYDTILSDSIITIIDKDGNEINNNNINKKKSSNWPEKSEESYLFKIFSNNELNIDILDKLFLYYDVIYEQNWMAYPKFNPPETIPDIKLFPDQHIYYNNALESTVSAIEISTISAKNLAMLLHFEFGPPDTLSIQWKKSDKKKHDEL